jgi:LmbE family N-acetylglucosaminyl deacetylase
LEEVSNSSEPLTLLVVLAHPDDEIATVAAMLAQRARGDRVVLCWLTRGEMTEAFGPVGTDEVIARRLETGRAASEILGVETRFLEFPDTGLRADRETALEVASLITDVRPDGILTWGDAWVRGFRHPDHQATGRIVRDAVTLARIQKCVAPAEPHRRPAPVFTYRGAHSILPAVGIDAGPYMDAVFELGRLYHEALEFPDRGWLEERYRRVGERWGVEYAEEYDAWESEGGLVTSLLPARRDHLAVHPERTAEREAQRRRSIT